MFKKEKQHLINMQIYKVASIRFIILYYPHQDSAETQHSPAHSELFTSRNENGSEKCFSEKKAKRIIIY